MNKIRILPEDLRNRIAAGEIVERPASVLKELVENAIDAGSSWIEADIEEGGRRLIRVTDNGHGMTLEDARLSFERHATSKLGEEADLEGIQTLGFRGEALPSIASVARVRLVTAPSGSSTAVGICAEGGTLREIKETAAPAGTLIEVGDLFYNTPARRKFMKAPATELSHIVHVIQQLALPHHWIHFRLTHNGQELLNMPSVRALRERTLQVLGQDWMDQLLELSIRSDGLKLTGFVSKPPFSFASRDHQEFLVNRRAIRNPLLAHALTDAYDTSMMRGRYPVAILFLEVPFDAVDVNIHPAKREIRFRDQKQIHDAVCHGIRERLKAPSQLKTGTFAIEGAVFEEFPRPQTAVLTGETGGSYSVFRRPAALVQETVFSPSILALGQVDRTYIVAQVGEELHIVDQHTAHERLLYDRLMAQTEDQRLELQPLLFSETVELPQALSLRLREILPALKEAGLELEEFGKQAFLIRSMPALLGPINGRQLLLDLLEDLEIEKRPKALSASLQQVFASMACHGAIKAHQDLGFEQMRTLLHDLQTVSAHTCPHGRPIRVTFNRSDLEKMFHRR